MTQAVKILAVAGSSQIASFNKKLFKAVVEGAKAAVAEVIYIDLLDYPTPLLTDK